MVRKTWSCCCCFGGIVQIYQSVYPTQPRIEARCNLATVLKEPQPAVPIKKEPLREGVPQPLENFRDPAVSNPFEWFYTRHYLKCTVSNSGNQEAKDVVLDVPFAISATVINKKTNILEPADYNNSINIGVLRPKAKIEFTAWTRDSAAAEIQKEDDYTLSYTGGVGVINLPYYAYGTSAKLAKTWDESWGYIILGIVNILILIGLTIHYLREYGQKSS